MHVPQDSMWQEILKTFWISGWTKQGLNKTLDSYKGSTAVAPAWVRGQAGLVTASARVIVRYCDNDDAADDADRVHWPAEITVSKTFHFAGRQDWSIATHRHILRAPSDVMDRSVAKRQKIHGGGCESSRRNSHLTSRSVADAAAVCACH